VNVLLARHLNLTALRFSGASATEWSWQKKKKPFFNHAKVYIIDDAVFYVGSDNLYPNNQQEFGYLVEGSTATARFVTDYWDKLWRYSGRYAINPSPGSVINRGGGGAT
jgi:phosphatidylserine/phosphatidylglycerophosphate/cardiolipin synthase-like enzyme